MTKKKTSNIWNTVTPFSKTIAMAMLIILPFAGFYLGMQYQKNITPYNPTTVSQSTDTIAAPSDWNTYTNRIGTATIQYPSTWTVKEMHTQSNRVVDDPNEINTAILRGKEGEITIEWGPMGFGGGCDPQHTKTMQIKNKTAKICNTIDETTHKEIWAPFYNDVKNDNITEARADSSTTNSQDVQTVVKILSTLELSNGQPQPTP